MRTRDKYTLAAVLSLVVLVPLVGILAASSAHDGRVSHGLSAAGVLLVFGVLSIVVYRRIYR